MSDQLKEMISIFIQSINDIDINQLRRSLQYSKEQEYSLYQKIQANKAQANINKLFPQSITKMNTQEAKKKIGLAQLCLPQLDAYDPMPDTKWATVRRALKQASSVDDIDEIVRYCIERDLYFGWEQMREAFTILIRPVHRLRLWQLMSKHIKSIENFPLIVDFLPEDEIKTLKKLYWAE